MKIMAISLIFITQKLKHEMLRDAHGSIADLKKREIYSIIVKDGVA